MLYVSHPIYPDICITWINYKLGFGKRVKMKKKTIDIDHCASKSFNDIGVIY